MIGKKGPATKLAFVDTNILLYAHARQAGFKQRRAVELLTDLWENHTGVLGCQVLQDFLSTSCVS